MRTNIFVSRLDKSELINFAKQYIVNESYEVQSTKNHDDGVCIWFANEESTGEKVITFVFFRDFECEHDEKGYPSWADRRTYYLDVQAKWREFMIKKFGIEYTEAFSKMLKDRIGRNRMK